MRSGHRTKLVSMGLSVAIGLASLATAHAAPTVSAVGGKVSHGEIITITGADFGTHPSFNNIGDTWKGGSFLNFRFKDFEDGQIKSDGFFPQRGGAETSFATNELGVFDGGPRNSTKFMKRQFVSDERGGISAKVVGAGNQLYSTFKFFQAENTQSGKFFRFYADSPQNNAYLSTGCNNFQSRGFSECSASSCSGATAVFGAGPEITPGRWHRIEVLADASKNNFVVSVNGVIAFTKSNWLSTNLALNNHTIDIPNMIDSSNRNGGTCPAVGSYNFDDIFINFTQARVELGDAATWSAVRKKEVQLPVTWNSSNIAVRLNSGEFTPGQQLFLYVVDASGAVNSNGIPVTLGSSSKVPNPPSGFKAQ